MYATGDVVANLLPINNLNGPTWRPSPNNTDWDTPEWRDIISQVATEPDPANKNPWNYRRIDTSPMRRWRVRSLPTRTLLLRTTNSTGLRPISTLPGFS